MKEYAFIDLHIHTEHSHEDGCDITVEQLLDTLQAMAEKKGGDVCFSITDHENMLGCLQADELLKKYPEKYNRLKFIPGMELNTSLKSLGLNHEGFALFRKCHLLGYGYDVRDPELRAFSILMNKTIKNQQNKKVNIGRQLVYVKKLVESRYAIKLPYAEVEKCLESNNFETIKSDLIDYLCKSTGKERTEIEQLVNENLIDRHNEDAQLKSKQDILDLIDMIKSAGGKVSIAHPRSVRYKRDSANRTAGRDNTFIQFITELQKVTNNGIDGLEIFHSENTNYEFFKTVYKYAKKYNMFLTCGSDYHGGKLHSSKVLSKCLNYTFEFCSLSAKSRKTYGNQVYNTVCGLPFVDYMIDGQYEGSKQAFIFKNIEKGYIDYSYIMKVMSEIPNMNKKAYYDYIEKYTNAKSEIHPPKQQKKGKAAQKARKRQNAKNAQANSDGIKYAPLDTAGSLEPKVKQPTKYSKKKHYNKQNNMAPQSTKQPTKKQVATDAAKPKKDEIKE